SAGVPASAPWRGMPPEMTNSAPSSAMKARYSRPVSTSRSAPAGWTPSRYTTTGHAATTATASLFRLASQRRPRNTGSVAISTRYAANGTIAQGGVTIVAQATWVTETPSWGIDCFAAVISAAGMSETAVGGANSG